MKCTDEARCHLSGAAKLTILKNSSHTVVVGHDHHFSNSRHYDELCKGSSEENITDLASYLGNQLGSLFHIMIENPLSHSLNTRVSVGPLPGFRNSMKFRGCADGSDSCPYRSNFVSVDVRREDPVSNNVCKTCRYWWEMKEAPESKKEDAFELFMRSYDTVWDDHMKDVCKHVDVVDPQAGAMLCVWGLLIIERWIYTRFGCHGVHLNQIIASLKEHYGDDLCKRLLELTFAPAVAHRRKGTRSGKGLDYSSMLEEIPRSSCECRFSSDDFTDLIDDLGMTMMDAYCLMHLRRIHAQSSASVVFIYVGAEHGDNYVEFLEHFVPLMTRRRSSEYVRTSWGADAGKSRCISRTFQDVLHAVVGNLPGSLSLSGPGSKHRLEDDLAVDPWTLVRPAAEGRASMLLVYADWCGFCTRFKPTWKSLSMPDVAKYSLNESEARARLAQVDGFPTILMRFRGLRSSRSVPYRGDRSPADIEHAVKHGVWRHIMDAERALDPEAGAGRAQALQQKLDKHKRAALLVKLEGCGSCEMFDASWQALKMQYAHAKGAPMFHEIVVDQGSKKLVEGVAGGQGNVAKFPAVVMTEYDSKGRCWEHTQFLGEGGRRKFVENFAELGQPRQAQRQRKNRRRGRTECGQYKESR